MSKNFPFFRGGGFQQKNFFSSLNMYQAKSGVKRFSLYWDGRGGSLKKIFFLVWTCIKPNLVSKIFPFTGGGGGGSLKKYFSPSLNMYQAKSGVKNFSLYWDQDTPPLLSPWTDTHLWKHNLPSYVRTRAVMTSQCSTKTHRRRRCCSVWTSPSIYTHAPFRILGRKNISYSKNILFVNLSELSAWPLHHYLGSSMRCHRETIQMVFAL